jgi:ribonuclease Z
MTDHILVAFHEDIKIRTEGLEHESSEGWKVNAHEVRAGVIYKDANVTVTAFPTKHGEWPETFGYRFDTADRSVVIAGDTTAVQATIDACRGCDVLIHEPLLSQRLENVPGGWNIEEITPTVWSAELRQGKRAC